MADIKVNCDEEDEESMSGWMMLSDAFILYTKDGVVDKRLVYVPQIWADIMTEDKGYEVAKGWYIDREVNIQENYKNPQNTTEVPFGEGAILKASDITSLPKLIATGAVKNAPTVTDVAAFTIAANCSPKRINVDEIIVNCDEEDEESMSGWLMLNDAIITYTDDGVVDKRLVYVPEIWAAIMTEDKGYEVTKGWYIDKEVNIQENYKNRQTEVFLDPGVGVIAKASDITSKPTLSIKSALATAED